MAAFQIKDKFVPMGLTFDDMAMSDDNSQAIQPDEVSLQTALTDSLKLNIPLLSAAMDTVTEAKFAVAIAQFGGLGVIHKNMTIAAQAEEVAKVKQTPVDLTKTPSAAVDDKGRLLVAGAVGVTNDTVDRAKAMVDAGVDAIILDSAHGHSEGVLRKVSEVRAAFPKLNIIAGNIATESGAAALYDAGADVVKIGIGPGSICTTRVVAGIGVPQLSAIRDAAKEAKRRGKTIIADGGAKTPDDILKAITMGGNAVMLGSMFSGTKETPGEVFEENGQQFKFYRGMGSIAAMENGSKDRYFQGEVNEAKKMVPEGIEARVAYKGELKDVLQPILSHLVAGFAKMGAHTVQEAIAHASSIYKTTKTYDYQEALVKGAADLKHHGLGYDETLLVPAASNVLPHKVNLDTTIGQMNLTNPLLASDLTDNKVVEVATAMSQSGGLGIVTAMEFVSDQIAAIEDIRANKEVKNLAAEVWLAGDHIDRISALADSDADAVVLYLPEAFDESVLVDIKTAKKLLAGKTLIVGAVEDPAIAKKMAEAGADGIIAGRANDSVWPDDAHFPFLTTVMTLAEVLADTKTAVIAQGGIHYSGDVVKAIAAGADAVMVSDYLVKEEVPADAIFQIDGGLRAGMGYTGSHDVSELKADAQFVQITDNGLKESHPHDVEITKKAPNYVEQERK
ncbi:inosine-5'-monophosphate dehydrogenase [Fructobacillus fructosus]|uniref:IMP dehydrogenase/GMP reductase (GuaB) n=2 Tax=Fructobacillus fructosus TaxID=1631 RepID=A0ABN9YXX4_9LACO|nr:inosine-5-monophosphate dehydrogenase [Fructobacillus fructosus KCTC 3544]MBC9118406.1 IMP dehydrogenase [Fructobacillus fructosus]MBD9364883.1 IMP dehydrogenase [Leuconostoc mesenteroides]GAP01514.1 inosine-5'-monophosphate dehydrogenase [Fructobacillus fructosus]CAK1248936.1 IMP dehydrogenase/GMP reductase (GuaB) [Fructobacillus fructosus]